MISQLVASLALAARLAAGPDTTLIASTQWLAAHLNDPHVVVVVVDHSDSTYLANHIRGARLLDYGSIVPDLGGLSSELPDAKTIAGLFEALGVSDDSHVILMGVPLMATRAFYTLDFFGKRQVSILAGGLPKWRAEGGAIETGRGPAVAKGHLTAHTNPAIVASADYVLAHIGKPGTSFIDTRTEGEYLGTEARRGLPSKGHIDGARRLEWQEMFTDAAEFTPKDLAQLQQMWQQRVAPGDSVVTYCLVGYRASGSYFMSRYLGYAVKLYDGSYDEWGKKNLPVVKTVTPLRVP